jgi:hypothetical protein
LLWLYVAFNVGAAVGLYWMFRVPKGKKRAWGMTVMARWASSLSS